MSGQQKFYTDLSYDFYEILNIKFWNEKNVWKKRILIEEI